jgi:hypothetical protein
MEYSHQLVQKLWTYCNILRDDGLSYGDGADKGSSPLLAFSRNDKPQVYGLARGGALEKFLDGSIIGSISSYEVNFAAKEDRNF